MRRIEAGTTAQGFLFVRVSEPPVSVDELYGVKGRSNRGKINAVVTVHNIAGQSEERTLFGFEPGEAFDPPEDFVGSVAEQFKGIFDGTIVELDLNDPNTNF